MDDSVPHDKGNGNDETLHQRTKKKFSPIELKKMSLQQKSRYLAYEAPPKNVAEAQKTTKRRLLDLRNKHLREMAPLSEEEVMDKEKHAKLIGQLKAAESRNRLRIMRLRYQANRAQEISHLISCQPIALKAVRLQALVPPYPDTKDPGDRLEKLDRERVERLLEDTKGLITNRIH